MNLLNFKGILTKIMNIKLLFFVGNICFISGLVLKIMHLSPILADFLIGFSLSTVILLIYVVFRKLESK